MKLNQIFTLSVLCLALTSCVTLQPATVIKNGNIKNYKYIYISQTKSLTSSTGTSINGQYYSTSKSVNPRDVIAGILVNWLSSNKPDLIIGTIVFVLVIQGAFRILKLSK